MSPDYPHVFRGFDRARAAASVSRIMLVYGGAFLVLWTLGLVVRGPRGWVLVLAPLLMIVGSKVWALRRLSVDVADGTLRYEGVSVSDDFDVAVDAVTAVYFDRSLSGRPLVLALADGDERVLEGLSRAAAGRLGAHLVASGARDLR